jgi:hypothetical protein
MTRILAIDPGSEKSGWVLYDAGRVVDSGTGDNDDVRRWIRDGQGAALLALEMAESFGAPVWSQVFTTVRWTGRFQEAWSNPDGVILVTRSQVKLELLGRRAGNDVMVRQALLTRVGVPGTKKAPGPTYGVTTPAWAALAVAVTAAALRGLPGAYPLQRDLLGAAA